MDLLWVCPNPIELGHYSCRLRRRYRREGVLKRMLLSVATTYFHGVHDGLFITCRSVQLFTSKFESAPKSLHDNVRNLKVQDGNRFIYRLGSSKNSPP